MATMPAYLSSYEARGQLRPDFVLFPEREQRRQCATDNGAGKQAVGAASEKANARDRARIRRVFESSHDD